MVVCPSILTTQPISSPLESASVAVASFLVGEYPRALKPVCRALLSQCPLDNRHHGNVPVRSGRFGHRWSAEAANPTADPDNLRMPIEVIALQADLFRRPEAGKKGHGEVSGVFRSHRRAPHKDRGSIMRTLTALGVTLLCGTAVTLLERPLTGQCPDGRCRRRT